MLLLYFAHVLIGLALLWSLSRGRRALLTVVGFVMPLSGLVVADGVGWSWLKLLPAFLLVGALVFPGGRPLTTLPGRRALLALALWATAVTAGTRIFDFELEGLMALASQYGWSGAQNEHRHAVQLVVQAGQWLVFALAYRLAASAADGRAAANGFIAGNVLSVVVGIYQAIAQGMDLPWLSVADGAALSGHLGTGNLPGNTLALGPLRVARLYGLGGEPKHTAALAVMAIGLLLQRDLADGQGVGPSPHRRPAMLLLVVGVALTLSTSGWLALAALTLGMTGASGVVRFGNALARRRVVRLGLNVGLGVLAVMLLSAQLGEEQRDGLVEYRLTDRLSSLDRLARFEPKDATAIAFLADRPSVLPFGCGVGGVDFFLLPYNERVDVGPGRMLTPTYFLTRTVGEVGLVGLGLVVGVLLAIIKGSRPGLGGLFVSLAPLTLVQPILVLTAFLFLAGALVGPRRADA
ncbi:MAG: hypothetical protein IV100_21590 [Myxococcales bacterium]|nr:hypothetical protein [Myxococcales bacterium]